MCFGQWGKKQDGCIILNAETQYVVCHGKWGQEWEGAMAPPSFEKLRNTLQKFWCLALWPYKFLIIFHTSLNGE